MHRSDGRLKCRCPAKKSARVIVWKIVDLRCVVQPVRQAVKICREFVTRSMDVFTQIDPSGSKKWKQLLQAHDLLLGLVAAVIYDDVKARYPSAKVAPKRTVGLIADKNLDPWCLVGATLGHNIDAVDERLRTKIIVPHR